MRFALLALPLALVILSGCTSPAPPSGVRSVDGVAPDASGALNVTTGAGLVLVPVTNGSALGLSLAPVVQSSVFQACASSACANVTVPRGALVAEAGVLSFRNLSLDAAGPDADSAIFFHHAGQETGAWIRWDEADPHFETSHDLLSDGNVTATGHLGTTTPLQLTDGRVVAVSTATVEGLQPTIEARGSARLVNGSANVTLPAAFVALASGEVTAQVTLTSDGPVLFIAEKTTDHLVVRATGAAGSNATFDWVAQAARKGADRFAN